jgi:hypothetical protein
MSASRTPPPDDDETRHERGCAYLFFGLVFAVVWAIVSAIYFASHK